MSLVVAFGFVLGGLAAATGAGWLATGVWARTLSRREHLAWALAIGLLIQTACLLLLIAVGVRASPLTLLLAEATVAAAAAWKLRKDPDASGARAAERQGSNATVLVLGLVAGAAWLIFFVGAISDAMWSTDFIAFWGYKGKIVFLTGEVPRRLFQDPALYFAHREYPLLVPLTLASLASWLGEWNDQALAILFPVCALATLLAISGFLSRRVSPLAGATAAALASLCFFLYRPANAGTAEVPFALSLVLLVSAAVDYARRDGASSLGRLAVASVFCAVLKQEGTLFVVLVAAALGLELRRGGARARAGRLAAVALLLPASAHWAALYFLRGDQTRRDFDFTLFTPARWPELPPIFASVAGRMLGTEGRQALVAILAVAVYLFATTPGIGDFLFKVFAVQMFLYSVAFTVSSFDPMYAIDGAFRRIAMSLFPAFALVLCSRLAGLSARSGGALVGPPVERAG